METFSFSSLGYAGEGGSFSPINQLMYFNYPQEHLLETQSLDGIRANLILWHEYQHFLQITTTTFGVNVFLWEYDRLLFTYQCIKELLNIVPKVQLPLLIWRDRIDSKKIKYIIDLWYRRICIREEVIGLLLGDCERDDSTRLVSYRGKTLDMPRAICPFVKPNHSSTSSVGMGARAIMEGAASLMELVYLITKERMGSENNKIIEDELKAWEKRHEQDPQYYLAIDQGAGLNPFTLLVLFDLALFTPIELDCSAYSIKRSPGYRFTECLREARKLPELDASTFHSSYQEYVKNLCKSLGWQTPWEMVTEKLLDFFTDEIPLKKYCNILGPASTIVRGLIARQKMPSSCAKPIPDIQYNLAEREKLARDLNLPYLPGKVIFLNEMQRIHPPPFVMAKGERVSFIEELAVNDVDATYKSAKSFVNEHNQAELADFIRMYEEMPSSFFSKTKHRDMLKSSYEEFFVGQRLVDLLWKGSAFRDQRSCLKLNGAISPSCQGGIFSQDFKNVEECLCKKVFQNYFPCSLMNDVSWIST